MHSQRSERLAIALILVAGTVVRIAAMSGRVLLDDEARFTEATLGSYGHLLSTFGGNVTQPAFLVSAKLLRQVLGDWIGIDAAVRLPSLIAGVLGIWATARLARRLLGPGCAVAAALFVAFNPYHVFYSHMATGYAMASTCSVLSVLCFVELVRGEGGSRARAALGYVAATMLAVHSHLGTLGVVGGEILALLVGLSGAASSRARLRIACLCGLAALGGVLLYAVAWSQMFAFREEWTEGAFSYEFVPFLLTATAGGRGVSIYALLVVALVGLLATLRSPNAREVLGVVLLWPLGVFLFFRLNGSAHYPWAHARFLFIAFPAVALALAAGARAMLAWRAAAGRGAAVLLLGILGASHVAKVADMAWGPKDANWPEVFATLEREAPGATLISLPLRFSAIAQYAGRKEARAPEIAGLDALRKERSRRMGLEPPVAFAVDLVPFDGPPWNAGWEIREFGATTILFRPEEERGGRNQHLEDLLEVTIHVLDYVEREHPPRDWIFWRLDPGHQHLFERESIAGAYRVLARNVASRVPSGKGLAPAVPAAKEALRPPDYWDMLAPHVDFLPR